MRRTCVVAGVVLLTCLFTVALLRMPGRGCLFCAPALVPVPLVALLTLSVGYPNNVTDVINANRQRYCDIHGLECILSWEDVRARCDSFEPPNAQHYKAWQKVHALRACLPRFIRVVWIDADALICNFRLTIESIVEETPGLSVIVGGNNCIPHPNTGVIVMERGDAAAQVLEAILELERDESFVRAAFWYEQSAIMHLLATNRTLAAHIGISRPTLQWFPSQGNKCMAPHPTSWVAHWAGCGGDPLCMRDIIIFPTFAHSPPGLYNMSIFEFLDHA